MLKPKSVELFDEPGCGVNREKSEKQRKVGCSARSLTPGAAAGGCAFDGAKIALQPIADAAHLVHGPIACEGNSWDSRHTLSSGPQLFRVGMTTDLTELDVIHGGEKKLFRAIKEIIERYRPPAVFVYVTCVPALIGDDVEVVCAAAASRCETPVIPVMAPGFAGSKNLGNKLAGQALLDHVIGPREPEIRTPFDVNLIGEYNVVGELWQVRPLLDRLGIRILASITGDGRYNDVACGHRARVNMVVCSQAMVALARQLEERYGTPYFEGSFYGVRNTSNALRQLSALLVRQDAPEDLIRRTELLIEDEEDRAARALEPYRTRLGDKRSSIHGRREVMVHGLCPARAGHGRGGYVGAEID